MALLIPPTFPPTPRGRHLRWVACWRSGAAPLRTHCAAQLGRGALVHLEVEPVVLDHHPIVRARRLDRHVVVQDVLEHSPRVALERIAVPARAGLLHDTTSP